MPLDRKVEGLALTMGVKENITLANIEGLGRRFLIEKQLEIKKAQKWVDELAIKTPSVDQEVNSLSGGNQQKVVIAKWLESGSEIIILNEPTRGIDVGTKVDIQKLVLKLASEGMSITFISSETDEMLRTCSRLVVMRDRKVVGELKGDELTQNMIMSTIAGGEK